MKSFLSFAVAAAALFGLSSCCCMFSGVAKNETTPVRKRACGAYDIITEQVYVAGVTDSKGGMSKGGMTQTVQRKVPRYKMVNERVPCKCWRPYCPDHGCCGTTGERTMSMASAQGWSGSPNIGLIPTMKPLAP